MSQITFKDTDTPLDKICKILAAHLRTHTTICAYFQSEFIKSRENNTDIKIDTEKIAELLYNETHTNKNQSTQTTPPHHTMEIQKLDEIIKTLRNNKPKTIEYKPFHGKPEEDIEEHIGNFEKIASLQEWDEKTQINSYIKNLKEGA